ncbi:MAG: alpha/beta hydrolase [Spirochaetes bacterium]|nr:alpha/beta hydrolase [Spirochaetota bacterium]
MDYSEYIAKEVTYKDYYIETSDKVSLKIIEFIPHKEKSGKPIVVFVAGWISHISGWQEVLKEITIEYRTIYVETREKYSSILPSGHRVSFSIQRMTEDLKEIIQKVIPEKRKFILSGSSLGATVILEYIALNLRNPEYALLISPTPEFIFPKLLSNIILISPVCFYNIVKPVVKWYLRNFRIDKKKEVEQVRKYEYTLDYADPAKLKANAISLKNYSVWNKLNKITTPVLLIGAASDSLHGTDNLKRLKKNIKQCKYTELSSNRETHSKTAGKLITDFINDNL